MSAGIPLPHGPGPRHRPGDATAIFASWGFMPLFHRIWTPNSRPWAARWSSKALDSASYEREREFVYQFLMELYGFPIAAERRTSAALFARKLSHRSNRTSSRFWEPRTGPSPASAAWSRSNIPWWKRPPSSLCPRLAEANPHLGKQGFYLDPKRRVVIFKVTYQQHKYNPLMSWRTGPCRWSNKNSSTRCTAAGTLASTS